MAPAATALLPEAVATAATSAPAPCAWLPNAPLPEPEVPDWADVAFLAFARKASKVLPLVGAFTAKTMPALQWLFGFVCLQYTQIGAV